MFEIPPEILLLLLVLLLYPVFNITKLLSKQPRSLFVGAEPCTSWSPCRDLAAGGQGRQGEQGCDAGQGTVQCLAVHETGTVRAFLLSSFSLSPEWATGPDRTFFCCVGSVPGPWHRAMISATSVCREQAGAPGFHKQLLMKMLPFCS